MIFTDEKIFTKTGYFNPKNDVVWADNRPDATQRDGLYSNEKYSVSIMLALGATWYGLTSPYFFQQGQYLNGQTYHDKLLPFYQKEDNELFGYKNWWFQQDGASSHTNRKPQQWCKKNFQFFLPKNRWPPNSSELNPLDYSFWNNISKHVKYGNVKKFNDLHRKVEKAIKKVEVNYVWDVINVFLSRVRSVENHNGELIFDEHT